MELRNLDPPQNAPRWHSGSLKGRPPPASRVSARLMAWSGYFPSPLDEIIHCYVERGGNLLHCFDRTRLLPVLNV